MVRNMQEAKKDKWLLYTRFVNMFIDYLKPRMKKTGDPVVLKEMAVRMLVECSSTRHDFLGKITCLLENMYPTGHWVYIKTPIPIEDKIYEEKWEKTEKGIKK